MKPDIIVCWPRNCDYPLWRDFIHKNRERFNLIIIAFTETHQGEDYRQFVRDALLRDYVLFVDIQPTPSGDDWRNYATNLALLNSYNAEWIWFTEQDFFPKENFWEYVQNAAAENDVIGVKYGERIHPCCLFMKRTALSKTSKNFGIIPDRLDHFGLIQRDITNPMNQIKYTIIPDDLWMHLNGLSHNMTLIYRGEKPNWDVPTLNKFLVDSFNCGVELAPQWRTLFSNYLQNENIIFTV